MNRAERRYLKKHMAKKLKDKADKITKYHYEYEGKDNDKLEKLVSKETEDLDFDELMVLMMYLEDTIGAPKS